MSCSTVRTRSEVRSAIVRCIAIPCRLLAVQALATAHQVPLLGGISRVIGGNNDQGGLGSSRHLVRLVDGVHRGGGAIRADDHPVIVL